MISSGVKSFIVCYIVTFYRLILLIDILICLVVTAVCLFFIKVLGLLYVTDRRQDRTGGQNCYVNIARRAVNTTAAVRFARWRQSQCIYYIG